MKKTLNEEISRIKQVMGCCKGKINEDIEAGSQQEAQMIQMAAQDIEEMGLTQEDLEINEIPTLAEIKQKIADEIINPFLKTARASDIKQVIIGLKSLKNNPPEEPSSTTTQDSEQPLNENTSEGGSIIDTFLTALKIAFVLQGPPGKAIYYTLGWYPFVGIMTGWLLLCIFKCYIYDLFGNNTNNIINKLVQIITLDFKNIFTSDPYVKGCGLKFY
jgi:hypothetical protein